MALDSGGTWHVGDQEFPKMRDYFSVKPFTPSFSDHPGVKDFYHSGLLVDLRPRSRLTPATTVKPLCRSRGVPSGPTGLVDRVREGRR